MNNYAGRYDVDELIADELKLAGIKLERLPECLRGVNSEVKTIIIGILAGWGFHRAWVYWIAEGPGIQADIAEKLHNEYGEEVRVAGHCGCPSPLEWYKGFAVGLYHVDTQQGLNALANVLRDIYINEN
ncbi:hypothetical protein LCGC14_1563430 [marine sediment metagenome]|uniref:Uncharacterized protein n=1 Tax=marine sediment metagenome TaxID=412755 RepID=A0A0F9ILU4_9ZZZZ